MYGYFVRRCADRGTAEDLTSETFLAAMDAARKPAPPALTMPWLIGVARHKLADHYRRRHWVPVAEVPEEPLQQSYGKSALCSDDQGTRFYLGEL